MAAWCRTEAVARRPRHDDYHQQLKGQEMI
jgi:hypothetical protein